MKRQNEATKILCCTWFFFVIFFGLIAIVGCGGGGGGNDNPSDDENGGGTQPPTVETVDRSNVSFVNNLRAKVKDGEWTLGEGLVATLSLWVGEADTESVLRHSELLNHEATGIVAMAYDYLEDGPDAEARAEISRLLGILMFTNADLEEMAGIGVEAAELTVQTAASMNYNCLRFVIDPEDLPEDPDEPIPNPGDEFEGVGDCLEYQSSELLEDLYTGSFRIFYPTASLPDVGWNSHHYEMALQGLEDSVRKLGGWFMGLDKDPPSINIVFSYRDLSDASAIAKTYAGEHCGIIVFPSMVDGVDEKNDNFKQVIAHEVAHCFQEEMFTEQNQVKYDFVEWREEGMCDYLSNIVYPHNNLEWGSLKELAGILELVTSPFDRAYGNFAFFQYLENRLDKDGLIALIQSLPTDENSGRKEQEEALAKYPDMKNLYHDFAKALTDSDVIDTGGLAIPHKIVDTNRPTEKLNEVKNITWPIDSPFRVSRYRLVADGTVASLDFKEEKGEVLESARPTNGATWTEVPTALPDEECEREVIMVVTTIKPESEYNLKVTDVWDADTDEEGLVGAWELDFDSIQKKINYIFPQQTVDSVTGAISVKFRDDGKMEVYYDNFEVKGHSDVSGLVCGCDWLHSEVTMTTNASGTDTYEIKSDYIFYGSLFEESFLEGTETMHTFQEGVLIGDIPIDVDETTVSDNPTGWALFGAAQNFKVQCEGTVLEFLSSGEVTAVFHRILD